MLLSEIGLTYHGKHSRRDMGMLWVEKDGHPNTPKINWNTYQIAGAHGNVLFPGESWGTMNFDGTLYPIVERPTQAQAQQLLRQVSAWLTAGRGKLIFDYEPDKYYLAELAAESKWSLKNWFGGEISVRFTAQPFARSVTEDQAAVTVTDTAVSITLTAHTGFPCPVSYDIENTGTADITGVAAGGITLSGMELAPGETLTIDAEPPVGAAIGSASAMMYATHFSPDEVQAGENTLAVTLSYGSGNKGAKVTARCRGMW